MLRNIMFVVLCSGMSVIAAAQSTPSTAKVIVYKWKEGGVTHYAKQPPRGVGNVTKLDEQGMVINDDADDRALFEAMRPARPARGGADNQEDDRRQGQRAAQTGHDAENSGMITREQRCAQAQEDIAVLQSAPDNLPVNVEDNQGNLIPMSDEEKAARLQAAQALVERLCTD